MKLATRTTTPPQTNKDRTRSINAFSGCNDRPAATSATGCPSTTAGSVTTRTSSPLTWRSVTRLGYAFNQTGFSAASPTGMAAPSRYTAIWITEADGTSTPHNGSNGNSHQQ